MKTALNLAIDRDYEIVVIQAQAHIKNLDRQLVVGEAFIEARVLHCKMVKIIRQVNV